MQIKKKEKKVKFNIKIKYISYILFLIIFFLIFRKHKLVISFSFLLFLAAISRTYNHFYFIPQLGFELYSTATIIAGLAFGPWLGFLMGIFSNLLATIFSGKIKIYTYVSIISWGIIGFVCGLLRPFNPDISLLGISAIIIYEFVTAPIFVKLGARITSAMFHTFTHIAISIFLFRTIVPIIYKVVR